MQQELEQWVQQETKIRVIQAMTEMNLNASPNTIRNVEMDGSEPMMMMMEESKDENSRKVFPKRNGRFNPKDQ